MSSLLSITSTLIPLPFYSSWNQSFIWICCSHTTENGMSFLTAIIHFGYLVAAMPEPILWSWVALLKENLHIDKELESHGDSLYPACYLNPVVRLLFKQYDSISRLREAERYKRTEQTASHYQVFGKWLVCRQGGRWSKPTAGAHLCIFPSFQLCHLFLSSVPLFIFVALNALS